MKKKNILVFIILLITTSCANKKNILYLQDNVTQSNIEINQSYINKLQADDILSIQVSSADNQGVAAFNIATSNGILGTDVAVGQPRFINYIIRQDGSIEFPVIGKIQLAGLSVVEAIELLKKEISAYVKKPIVILEWLNFKYSVLGEVTRPGQFSSKSERVTILEALSNAGDLTIFGKRKNIILIRENNGKRSHFTIDLTSKEFIKSEAYYIKQNDVIIVSPNNAKVQSSAFNQNSTIYISIASVVLALINIYLTSK
ncbi:MAG: polysaccharide biosynthesis/export family protein [Flavobacterium sp.]